MFDFQVSKHPHYDEACRAFAKRHNMAKLQTNPAMSSVVDTMSGIGASFGLI
ncbi:MAG: hypothetical protein RSA95_07215 [Citrobacter sp.]